MPSKPGRTLDLERISRSLTSNLDSTVHRAQFVKSPPAFTTEAGRGTRDRGARLGVHDLLPVLPAARDQHPAGGASCSTGRSSGRARRSRSTRRSASARSRTASSPRRRSSPAGSRMRSAEGISQIATTLYNAAFFAGVKLVAHQAHQFYISRYPMGREATVSWGGPELIFRNDWPAAILMKLSASSSGDHRALLLEEARPSRRDDDGRAVRVRRAADDHGAELRSSGWARRAPCSRRAHRASRCSTRGRCTRGRSSSRTSGTRCATTRRTRSSRSARRR